MNRNLLKLSIIIVFSIFFLGFHNGSTAPAGEDMIKDISSSIEKMDAKKLAEYFSSTIDIEMNEINGNFSKTQAEIILRDFFKHNPALSFNVNHQGESDDGSKFFIGTYKTNIKNFRVYGLLKKEAGKLVIRQLQFEIE